MNIRFMKGLTRQIENFIFKIPNPIINSSTRDSLARRWGATIGEGGSMSRHVKLFHAHNIKVGDETIIGDVILQAWEVIEIGNNVIINDGSILLTGSHDINSPSFAGKCRPIRIGNYVWIATKAMVLSGVTIGEGAIVGAGAVVRENVPPFGIVIGNPAQVIGYRRCREFTYSPKVEWV